MTRWPFQLLLLLLVGVVSAALLTSQQQEQTQQYQDQYPQQRQEKQQQQQTVHQQSQQTPHQQREQQHQQAVDKPITEHSKPKPESRLPSKDEHTEASWLNPSPAALQQEKEQRSKQQTKLYVTNTTATNYRKTVLTVGYLTAIKGELKDKQGLAISGALTMALDEVC